MPAEKTEKTDYQTLKAASRRGSANSHDPTARKFSGKKKEETPAGNLINPSKPSEKAFAFEPSAPETETAKRKLSFQ